MSRCSVVASLMFVVLRDGQLWSISNHSLVPRDTVFHHDVASDVRGRGRAVGPRRHRLRW